MDLIFCIIPYIIVTKCMAGEAGIILIIINNNKKNKYSQDP